MSKRNQVRSQAFRRAAPFAAGVLIGTSVVTPVFAATLDVDKLQPLVLLVSLIVLLIGLTLKAVATPRSSQKGSDAEAEGLASSDMRWQPTGSAIDIAMPRNTLR